MRDLNLDLPNHLRKLDDLSLSLAEQSFEYTGPRLAKQVSPILYDQAGLKTPRLMMGHTDFYPNPVLGIPVERAPVMLQLEEIYSGHSFIQLEPITEIDGNRTACLAASAYNYLIRYADFPREHEQNPIKNIPIEFQESLGKLTFPNQWQDESDRPTLSDNTEKLIRGVYGSAVTLDDDLIYISGMSYQRLRALMVLTRNDKTSLDSQVSILRAVTIMSNAHANQFRRGTNAPYWVHPEEDTTFVAALITDECLAKGNLLHDTPEDGPHALVKLGQKGEGYTHAAARIALVKLLGEDVADLVMDLTKTEFDESTIPPSKLSEDQKGRQLFRILSRSVHSARDSNEHVRFSRVRLAKIVDRLYNLRDWPGINISSAYGQLHETIHYILPAIELSLSQDLGNKQTKNLKINKVTSDVLDLLRWQVLHSAVAYYKACKTYGVEPIRLCDPKNVKDEMTEHKKHKIQPRG